MKNDASPSLLPLVQIQIEQTVEAVLDELASPSSAKRSRATLVCYPVTESGFKRRTGRVITPYMFIIFLVNTERSKPEKGLVQTSNIYSF